MSIGNSRINSREGEEEELDNTIFRKWKESREDMLIKDLYKIIRQSQAE